MVLYSEAGCILRVDMRCEQCKYQILNVLSSIVGGYNVDIDGIRGLVMVSGEVDPNMLIRAVASTGRHAEVVRMNFKHPNWFSTAAYHAGPIGYSQLPMMDYSGQYYPPYAMAGNYHSYGMLSHRRRRYGGYYNYSGSYYAGGNYCACGHY